MSRNIFSSAFAQTGRSKVIGHVKMHLVNRDSNADSNMFVGAHNITVRRNIFVNFDGMDGGNVIIIGQDGHDFYEAYEVIVENSLLLGNSPVRMRSPFGIKGARDVMIRNNTDCGNLPAFNMSGGLALKGRINPAGIFASIIIVGQTRLG